MWFVPYCIESKRDMFQSFKYEKAFIAERINLIKSSLFIGEMVVYCLFFFFWSALAERF